MMKCNRRKELSALGRCCRVDTLHFKSHMPQFLTFDNPVSFCPEPKVSGQGPTRERGEAVRVGRIESLPECATGNQP